MSAKPTTTGSLKISAQQETLLSVGILGTIVVMLIPLPALLLDMLLALNLGISILLLLVTLSTRRALELSVFPSLLLLLTLYRLSLNVATTRLILLHGDAGEIVAAFGAFVVGGNVVVGLVIFLILVVIQFVVITKGAGRISEVAARFTLDALPGKQLAIDAELTSGAITDVEARRRRQQLAAETEFYASMDGASKFVRGDAIAGLIITAINLLGGMVIGVRNGMSLGDSLLTYSILTIGDGLVSQIPALVIATTAGILTTKATSEESLGHDIGRQLFHNRQPLWIGVTLFGVLGLLPGMPMLPFLSLALASAWGLWQTRADPEADLPSTAGTPGTAPGASPAAAPAAAAERPDPMHLRDFLLTDRATVEVGRGLTPLLQPVGAKGLSERITNLRREFSRDHGLWIPPIRVQVNTDLPGGRYRVLIAGRDVGSGDLSPDDLLAILPEGRHVNLPGTPTTEPVFKAPAKWIPESIGRQAKAQGCTVVDAPSVLITHLSELLERHGHELLSRESLKQMLDSLKDFAPTVLEELRGESVRMGVVHQVLVQLAEDRVPLADLSLVLESILNHAPHRKSVDDLTDAVRTELGHLVCARHLDAAGTLRVLALQPQLDQRLREALAEGQLALGPTALERLIVAVSDRCRAQANHPTPPALLVHHSLRRPLKRLLRRATLRLGFVSFRELPSDIGIEPVGLVRTDEVFDAAADGLAGRVPAPRAAEAA